MTTWRSEHAAGWLALPSERRALRLRALRDGLVVAGWMASVVIIVVIPLVGRSLGYDAFSYWFSDLSNRYALGERGIYELGAFRYAPPIGLAFSWFGQLPWWLYLSGWFALMAGCLAWLGGRWTLALLALPPVALEFYHGNIHLLMAVAIALGFRYPMTWALILLTKLTPGVGLLWFAVRREWRSLAIALAATVVVSAISYVVAPALWVDWFESLRSGLAQPASLSIPPPLWARLPVAVALVVWGARTDRRWTVAVAAMLALPNLWPHGLVVALGALPFILRRPTAALSASSFARTAGVCLFVGVSAAIVASPFVAPLLESASWVILNGATSAAPR